MRMVKILPIYLEMTLIYHLLEQWPVAAVNIEIDC